MTKAFIEDMATAYAEADLVVARAGALTLAELAIAGRPAILIPLPTAADDHQRKNAEQFAQAGAALVLDQRSARAEDLAARIAELARDSGSGPAWRRPCADWPGRMPRTPSSILWKRWRGPALPGDDLRRRRDAARLGVYYRQSN